MTPLKRLGSGLFTSAFSFVALLLCACPSLAATADDWRSRSVYQVLTDRFARSDGANASCEVESGAYCGGTWRGIVDNLDYIQGMNFDAVWISPVVAQLPQQTGDGEAYTGYWQQDLYSLNDHFGSADDLRQLAAALHARGMLLMLDVVVNHMGYAGNGWSVDYSIFNPFDDAKYFHDFAPIVNATNQTDVEVGWLGDTLVSLADVRTEDPDVRAMYHQWISQLVSNYSVDGLRIDTCLNVEPGFFAEFVNASGVFATGEVLNGDNSLSCRWEGPIGSILNYPIYFPLTRAFASTTGSINDLSETILSNWKNCEDPTLLGSFSENHDQPRFASLTPDLALAKNVLAYTVMADGIPIVYQGQEQHMQGGTSPYTNRAPLWWAGYDTSSVLYEHIAALNALRRVFIATSPGYTRYNNMVIYEDLHQLVMRKGFDGAQVLTVLTNDGAAADDFVLPIANSSFPAGTQLTEVLSCTSLTVNATGWIDLPMGQGLPKILYPTGLLYGSKFCGLPDAPSSGRSLSTATTTPSSPAASTGASASSAGTSEPSPAAAAELEQSLALPLVYSAPLLAALVA